MPRSWPRSAPPACTRKGSSFPTPIGFRTAPRMSTFCASRTRRLPRRLDAAWRDRSPDVLLKTDYEALILASIIEKETALATERRLIAGVFHERLRRNMRLQTDPTVIYGLGDALRRQSAPPRSRARYAVQHLYARGLPPTPIALPGAGLDRSGRVAREQRRALLRRDGPRATAATTFPRRSRSTNRPCATILRSCDRRSRS